VTPDRDPATHQICLFEKRRQLFSHAWQLLYAWGTDRQMGNLPTLTNTAAEPGPMILVTPFCGMGSAVY